MRRCSIPPSTKYKRAANAGGSVLCIERENMIKIGKGAIVLLHIGEDASSCNQELLVAGIGFDELLDIGKRRRPLLLLQIERGTRPQGGARVGVRRDGFVQKRERF